MTCNGSENGVKMVGRGRLVGLRATCKWLMLANAFANRDTPQFRNAHAFGKHNEGARCRCDTTERARKYLHSYATMMAAMTRCTPVHRLAGQGGAARVAHAAPCSFLPCCPHLEQPEQRWTDKHSTGERQELGKCGARELERERGNVRRLLDNATSRSPRAKC